MSTKFKKVTLASAFSAGYKAGLEYQANKAQETPAYESNDIRISYTAGFERGRAEAAKRQQPK